MKNISRRDFMKLSGVAVFSAIMDQFPASASTGSVSFRAIRRVDFHTHVLTPSYANGLKQLEFQRSATDLRLS